MNLTIGVLRLKPIATMISSKILHTKVTSAFKKPVPTQSSEWKLLSKSCQSWKCIIYLTCKEILYVVPKQTVKECTEQINWNKWHADKKNSSVQAKNANYLVRIAINYWLLLELQLTRILTITLYAHSAIVITI
jgi:hypothetical protein